MTFLSPILVYFPSCSQKLGAYNVRESRADNKVHPDELPGTKNNQHRLQPQGGDQRQPLGLATPIPYCLPWAACWPERPASQTWSCIPKPITPRLWPTALGACKPLSTIQENGFQLSVKNVDPTTLPHLWARSGSQRGAGLHTGATSVSVSAWTALTSCFFLVLWWPNHMEPFQRTPRVQKQVVIGQCHQPSFHHILCFKTSHWVHPTV